MNRSEFNKFYGDRLLGLLARAYAEIKAVVDARQGGQMRLMDAAREGEVINGLMRDARALGDEIARRLIADPVAPEPSEKLSENGKPKLEIVR